MRDVERPSLIYVCMEDRPRGELIVVTLWEDEGRSTGGEPSGRDRKDAAVPRRWTRR